ncbi:MAG: sigma-70 family RNA polymerase sigma factor [Pirellulales bacterium]|nr:sigma-70 family RNA polymerase sigma factor [Pirellulales bacterium]
MATASNPVHKLFLKHQKDVYAYILTLVPDRNDAEDVFQQTCLALLEKQSEFDLGKEFFPWACGFALNEVRRFRRVHYRERVRLDDAAIEALANVQFKSAKKIEAQLDLLMECLAELPADKHELLMQSYSYHGRLKELAGWLRIEIDALYKRLGRIRRTLFECIERGKERYS